MDNIVYQSVVHKTIICGLLCVFTIVGMAQLKADFTMDVPGGGCSPLSVAFINTSTGTSTSTTYEWDFGNGSNKGHDKDAGSAYITEKKYTITLTATDGAQTSTIQKTVTVYKKPTIDFSINTLRGCAPFLVDFSATATAGDGSISKYLWDFGDGKVDSTSNTAKVSHTYESAAKPPVSVTVVNSYGCYVSTDRSGIVVLPPVIAAFSAPKATLCTTAESVSFTNSSTGPGTLTYSWNFGDGQYASDTQPLHPYAEKGSYDVTLIATSSEGCTDTLQEPDFVNVANFNTDFELPAVVCTNGQTVFTNKSTPEASSTVWEIKGVSGSYSGQTFSHTFSTPKKYTIKMTNTYGACKESVEKEIEVKSGHVLKGFVVDLDGACGAPVTVEFKDTSSTSVKWQWNFGNGDTASTREPSYTYNTDGSFSVLLTATDAGGCVNKVSQTIKLLKPDVKVNTSGPNSGCPGFKMGFAADNAADIRTYQWIFGDGDTSTAARPFHVFNKVGDYTVTLNYVTKTDCAGKVTYGTVSVFTKPVADFSVESGEVCGASPVTFTNLTTGNAGDWLWDFGDDAGGDVSSEPTHYYNQDGNYNVTLIVGNGACKDTVTKSGFIKVLPPFPSILPRQQTCTSGEVIFNQDNTTNKATKMWWDFGDGVVQQISSSQQSTTHVYDKTGRYQAYLIAERGQCTVKDSVFFDVLLEQKPQLAATLTTVCGSGDLNVTISGLEKNPYYADENNNHYTIQAWQYGDGTKFTPTYVSADNYFVTGYNATITNLDNGKKNIRVIIQSTTYPYCTDTSNYISLIVKGPKAAFDFTQNNVCFEKPIIFKDKSVAYKNVSIKKWRWNFGDDSTVMYTDLTYPKNGITEHAY
ncbi:MAG TPA: PKD domain-containing protein, partial [Agriterribacter sp.]|nr:PKD domain-containing protein [Agriterribacter sp.]